MKFEELHEAIPYVRYGKEKCLTMSVSPGVSLLLPGRHAEQTTPKGGDFCVIINDSAFERLNHQFKHQDLFHDIELKSNSAGIGAFMEGYYSIITGADPASIDTEPLGDLPGIDSLTFYYAVQCLAVAEHRRYAKHEEQFGGRFLPFRFCAGVAEKLWSAADGSLVQKYGRPAVERLEKNKGVPTLTKKLMGI